MREERNLISLSKAHGVIKRLTVPSQRPTKRAKTTNQNQTNQKKITGYRDLGSHRLTSTRAVSSFVGAIGKKLFGGL